MAVELDISLLGELRVTHRGQLMELPSSRKARAVLAFLAATGRPHRRERLCELFFDRPNDPKAALRWVLTKLRKVVDTPDKSRIVADRERVAFDGQGVSIDLREVHSWLEDPDQPTSLAALESMANALEEMPFEGLDGAGGERFDFWLTGEREDTRLARRAVLSRLVAHPDIGELAAAKWRRHLLDIDPDASEEFGGSTPASLDPTPLKQKAQAMRSQRIGFCNVRDGTKIAYASVGSGPPILKAANWLTHLEFDWTAPIWGHSFAELARTRTFIRYDERGNGLSDWNVEDLGFDAFVEDLEAVADALALDRFPLLGISQGAAVSIEYAVRHPERVSGLILMSGYAAGWRIHATREEQARRDAVLSLTKVGWGTDNPAYRHIFSQTFMPDAPPEDLEWFDDFQRLTTSPENAAKFQDAFGYIDVRERLAQVQAPTIVFHSRDDQRIPLEHGRELAAGIPRAEFVALDSANHILVESEPSLKEFTELTYRFLRENGI